MDARKGSTRGRPVEEAPKPSVPSNAQGALAITDKVGHSGNGRPPAGVRSERCAGGGRRKATVEKSCRLSVDWLPETRTQCRAALLSGGAVVRPASLSALLFFIPPTRCSSRRKWPIPVLFYFPSFLFRSAEPLRMDGYSFPSTPLYTSERGHFDPSAPLCLNYFRRGGATKRTAGMRRGGYLQKAAFRTLH